MDAMLKAKLDQLLHLCAKEMPLSESDERSIKRILDSKISTTELQMSFSDGYDGCSQERQNKVPLILCIAKQHVSVVRMMLEAGADPNSSFKVTPYDSIPMLEFALQSGNIDIVRMFIEAGADVNAFDRGGEHDSCSSPMLSFALADAELAKIMIEAGADVNAADIIYGGHSCATMLAAASNAETLDVARLLIKAGANVNSLVISERYCSDDYTSNILSDAARVGNYAAVQLLLQNSADPTVTFGANGKTAADIAAENGHMGIRELLKEHEAKFGKRHPDMFVVHSRKDGGSTILRCRPDATVEDSAWVTGQPHVQDRDIIQVLRMNAEGEAGFAWVRVFSTQEFGDRANAVTNRQVEGFVKIDHLHSCDHADMGCSHFSLACVCRSDGGDTTMLRRRASSSRDESVWVQHGHCVTNGDFVHVLQRNHPFGEPGFSVVRDLAKKKFGFIKTEYLSLRPNLTSTTHECVFAQVKRQDCGATTILRCRPTVSREESDWVEGRHLVSQGEAIDVLRFNDADEDGFAWVRSRSEPQKQGFIRSDYISYTVEHKSGR